MNVPQPLGLTAPFLLTQFTMVRDFHEKFGVPVGKEPQTLSPEDAAFRIKFLREELLEYIAAVESGDIVKQFDALIDLVYVALGTAVWQGFPFDGGFNVVHAANMTKIPVASAEESAASSGRGHKFDIVKPEGWTPPDEMLREMLRRRGANV